MQVENLLTVLEDKGPEYLETYRVPLLSWEGVKSLKGPDTIGLPLTGGDDSGEGAGKGKQRVAGLLEGGAPLHPGHQGDRGADARRETQALSQHDEGMPAGAADRPVLDDLD